MIEDYLLLKQAALTVDVPYATVYVWVKSGALRSTRVGKCHFVRRSDVERIATDPSDDQMMTASMYRLWRNIYSRCHRPGNPQYARYGARGIEVWVPWRTSFAQFQADVVSELGERPHTGRCYAHLDRVDNDRGYEPGNIQWLSPSRHTQKSHRSGEIILRGKKVLDMRQAQEIRRLARERRRHVDIAQQFGVSRQMVSRIVNNHSWVAA